MKNDKLFIGILIALLSVGIIVPVIILISNKNLAEAGQIGDTFGGTSAPFINISAILTVLLTYFYQKRNDKKNTEKEILLETINNIKSELEKVEFIITTTSGNNKEKNIYKGKDALKKIIYYLNDNKMPVNRITEINEYKQLLTIFKYLNSTIEYIKQNNLLTKIEAEMLLSNLSLFYRNNLYIEKDQRGEEICNSHGILHELPTELIECIKEIETKI